MLHIYIFCLQKYKNTTIIFHKKGNRYQFVRVYAKINFPYCLFARQYRLATKKARRLKSARLFYSLLLNLFYRKIVE